MPLVQQQLSATEEHGMTDHVKQPALCDECHRDILSRKADGNAQHSVYCAHTGTQAIVTVKSGQIVFWTISGPMTIAEAEQLTGLQAQDGVMPMPPAIN